MIGLTVERSTTTERGGYWVSLPRPFMLLYDWNTAEQARRPPPIGLGIRTGRHTAIFCRWAGHEVGR